MKKYLNVEEFVEFLDSLEYYKITEVFIESVEDGSVSPYNFMRMSFTGSNIILYSHPYECIGIIQDTPVSPWEDYAKGVYEDFTVEGEYKLFIKEERKQ